jgi:hypothetical protein
VTRQPSPTWSSPSPPSSSLVPPRYRYTSPRPLARTSHLASPSLDSGSDIEVTGNVILTPSRTSIPSLKRTEKPDYDQTGHINKPSPARFSPPVNGFSPSAQLGSLTPPRSSPPLYIPFVSPYGSSPTCTTSRRASTSSFDADSSPPSPQAPASPRRPPKPRAWHDGLYCVEFADGLGHMAVSALSQEDAFYDAFPGRPWVRRTFHDNKKQWLELANPSERAVAVAAGKTSQGLWRRFSKTHPIVKRR